jgi:hypothetical protein
MTKSFAYGCSARDYLFRAKQMIAEGDHKSMFYAAFELRCGIEARMHEYLRARDEERKKKKSGWRMAELHGQIEAKFRLGMKCARWALHDKETGDLLACFYYTPVTPRLKHLGQQLGNFLHVMKDSRATDDPWWDIFREILDESAKLLSTATMGVMLGPAMIQPGTNRVDATLLLPAGTDVDALMKRLRDTGEMIMAHISYPDALPHPLEPQAVMWRD